MALNGPCLTLGDFSWSHEGGGAVPPAIWASFAPLSLDLGGRGREELYCRLAHIAREVTVFYLHHFYLELQSPISYSCCSRKVRFYTAIRRARVFFLFVFLCYPSAFYVLPL